MTETADGVAIERTPRGRAIAATQRAAKATSVGALALLALTAVDAWMQPHLWPSTFALAIGGGALCGVIFGVLGWLSRARWELDPASGVARWRVTTILGQDAEAELPLAQVARAEVTTSARWGRTRYQLWLRFRDGQGEQLAAASTAPPLAAMRDAILARLPPGKSL